jgi:hypothetical protein
VSVRNDPDSAIERVWDDIIAFGFLSRMTEYG